MPLTKTLASGFDPVSPSAGEAMVRWLGQAGFLVEIAGKRIVIDPYLSDSLADKYRGTKFPHQRMMPIPIVPEDLHDIDWLLCTHAHTDHMDPGSIPALLTANPSAQVLVPSAEAVKAVERGVPLDRMVTIDAGERRDLDGFWVAATAAAHEELSQNAQGKNLYLGYVIGAGGLTIWHSGDTIPYPGLASVVAPLNIDLALLPINGRDAERATNGVPGNLTVEEAVTLTDAIGAGAMLGHHYGLFEFNTQDPDLARATISKMSPTADVELAELKFQYTITAGKTSQKTRVLAVCRGNICRSPTAEALLRKYLHSDYFSIESAAVMDWNIGKKPDPRSVQVAADRGLDISEFTARQITTADYDKFDVILGMDVENMEALAALRPNGARARIAHMGSFLEAGRITNIPDPYYDEPEAFAAVFDMIETAAQRFTAWAGEVEKGLTK